MPEWAIWADKQSEEFWVMLSSNMYSRCVSLTFQIEVPHLKAECLPAQPLTNYKASVNSQPWLSLNAPLATSGQLEQVTSLSESSETIKLKGCFFCWTSWLPLTSAIMNQLTLRTEGEQLSREGWFFATVKPEEALMIMIKKVLTSLTAQTVYKKVQIW